MDPPVTVEDFFHSLFPTSIAVIDRLSAANRERFGYIRGRRHTNIIQIDELYDRLVAAGPDALAALNQQTIFDSYPVHVAAKRGSVPFLRLLIDAGADPEQLSLTSLSHEETPLMVASENGRAEATRFLVEEMQVDVNKQDSNGKTALYIASCSAFDGATEIMEILLQNNADPNIQTSIGDTALIGAIQSSHADNAALLLDYGADQTLARTYNGMTAMHSAVFDGNNENLSLLLNSTGADSVVEKRNSNGATPLDVANFQAKPLDWANNQPFYQINMEHIEDYPRQLSTSIDLLLQHYKGLVTRQKGDLCLHWLLRFAEYGTNAKGKTTAALPVGNLTMDQMMTVLASLVTENPALVTSADTAGAVPLLVACRRRGTPLPVIQFLIQQAPDTDHRSRDRAGNTPLHALCSSQPSLDVFQYLLKCCCPSSSSSASSSDNPGAAAIITKETDLGWTPLMVACMTDASADVIRLLLAKSGQVATLQQLQRYYTNDKPRLWG